MKKYIVISILFAFSFSYYEVGESISISDQSLSKSTCFAGNGYDVNDDWELSDWNGELNGGDYNVIFLEMSATWWPGCYDSLSGPEGIAHFEFEDNSHVKFVVGLSDLNQPYSCAQWGNVPEGGACQIVHDTNTGGSLYGLYGNEGYIPSYIWINQNMEVIKKTNSASGWSIGNYIEEMLEDCGGCYVDDTYIEDYGSSSQSYQQYCCEEFGGNYITFSDPQENYCEDSDSHWVKLCTNCSNTPGDLNSDQTIDVLDVVSVVNIILGVSDPEECESISADSNSDGVINIQDVINIVNEVLG